jgi:hypothetical protein
MQTQRYSIQQPLIESLLSWVKEKEIAIPEIQRPFVWDRSKVRDLMDSIYQGFPIGYIITWKNPDVRLKDGKVSAGKKVLIDGQQRITSLQAALMDEYVVNKDYERVKIKIAFHPITEKFEVQTPIILKDRSWLADISSFFSGPVSLMAMHKDYMRLNPDADEFKVEQSLGQLANLAKRQIGVIELNSELDIEMVTEIFIRINSKGVVLSQADFAMSKIASNEKHGGPILRKSIDYFCHLSKEPQYFDQIRDHDKEFAKTDAFAKMSWLRHDSEDLYDPDYTDVLRVTFGVEFGRGKLADLVSLLSGRDFEKRTFEDHIVQDSFTRMNESVMRFINESDFKHFTKTLLSAGFIDRSLIRSQNAVNFAYMLYLHLRKKGKEKSSIDSVVRRWYVMSILTERATGSFESTFDYDIKQLNARDAEDYLAEIEAGQLSDSFWNAVLPGKLDTSVASSPFFGVFLASQVKAKDHGLFSKHDTIENLIKTRGDVHHIFPKDLLKKAGLGRSQYNRLPNLCFIDQPSNIKISNKPPEGYFNAVRDQIRKGKRASIGGLEDEADLLANLGQNCIPESVFEGRLSSYEDFIQERKQLMAKKIKRFYGSL